MHTKHLKMARGEGDSGIRSHFVERMVKLPMVHVAWDYAANTYSNIKESNKLVNFTLTNAEKSVTFVAGQAKPVVMKFEKQIQAVDNLACKGLGTLEEKVPFITKPADEIITDTRKLYTNTIYSRLENLRKYGNDKVKSVTDYSLEKANAILGKEVVDSLLNTVDGALVITENYLDRFLPPTPEEKKKSGKDEDSNTAVSRLVNIPNKILHRSYRTLVLKFEYAQERSIELLLYPVGMIESSKVYLENVLQYVVQAWESFNHSKTKDADNADGEKSQLEEQLLHLGRLVSRQMAAAHTTATSYTPVGSDDCDFEEDPVHDFQDDCFDCYARQNPVGCRNYKSFSSTPAYVHLWICVLA